MTTTIKKTPFLNAYVEAALWSSINDAGEPFDKTYSYENLSETTLQKAADDCASFQEKNVLDLHQISDEQARHDFWLTRNRHGAGFWDRGLGERGERLTNAAHAYGELSPVLGDDGKIHFE